MKPTTFAVKDFSALHSTTEATFAEAEATARRYSAEGGGNCPATITDSHGCEWSVWAIGDIQRVSCPAVESERAGWCDCANY